MRLEAVQAVDVTLSGSSMHFTQGERIHTENGYKYRVEDFAALLRQAGFAQAQVWTDSEQQFAVVLARVV